MKLVILSNTAHYRDQNGTLVGHGPTITEISYLAQIFDEIRHVAVLRTSPAPSMALPYTSDRVHLIPVPVAGGDHFRDKLHILRLLPLYLRTMLAELKDADAVHVRCPSNIGLMAIVLLALVRNPQRRWVKYAGNWKPAGREAWSYTFQRWWLNRGWHHGIVSVNGHWPHQPAHVRTFVNPSLTDEQLQQGAAVAEFKTITSPLRMLYVGRIDAVKGVGRAVEVVSRLRQEGIDARFDVVGDGQERIQFEQQAAERGIAPFVTFHGWLPREAIDPLYTQSHLMIFPSASSEGWPKVLSEAMAYGVVPIASNVSSIPQYLDEYQAGRCFDPYDVAAYAAAIAHYVQYPAEWKQAAQNGLKLARLFSFSNYLHDVRDVLNIP